MGLSSEGYFSSHCVEGENNDDDEEEVKEGYNTVKENKKYKHLPHILNDSIEIKSEYEKVKKRMQEEQKGSMERDVDILPRSSSSQ